MPKVYVARHGETTWNLAGRYQGRRESALSALGAQQATALAEHFAGSNVKRIVSSPLLRCHATALMSARRLDLEVETDERLIEIGHGTWEGRMRDEISQNDAETYHAWRLDPHNVSFDNGETLWHVKDRWDDFQRHLDPQVDTLVVTHDAVVRVGVLSISGRPLADLWKANVENCGFAEFDVAGKRWTLHQECAVAHLAGLRAATEGQAL